MKKMFYAACTVYASFCVEAESEDEAYELAQKELEKGVPQGLLNNISENGPQVVEITGVGELD